MFDIPNNCFILPCMTAKEFYNTKTRSFRCPGCNHEIKLSEQEIRTLAGMLMGSSISERKSRASADNGKMGGRFKSDDPRIGGIIAPATASRYVKAGKAAYGDYVDARKLQEIWEQAYGQRQAIELAENPSFDQGTRYRIVFRNDISGRIDAYSVDYYRQRKLE